MKRKTQRRDEKMFEVTANGMNSNCLSTGGRGADRIYLKKPGKNCILIVALKVNINILVVAGGKGT